MGLPVREVLQQVFRKEVSMKRLGAVLVAIALIASVGFAQAKVPAGIAGHKGVIKIAVIRNLGSDDHTNQFLAGAKEEGEALGFKVDTFITNGEDAKFQDYATNVMNQDYDGVILSHGKDPYATDLVKQIVAKGKAVSVFDTALSGTVDGVTATSQKDESLAEMSLGQMVKDFKGRTKFIKLWVAGFPPMERRQVIYKKVLQENPGMKELELIGAVSADVPGDTANKVGAALAKYPQGQVDAIWGSWDAFAQGAYKALQENGRTEIKLYGIDVSNQDLQLMQEPNSPWVCTAAVDPKLIGRINMRLVAKKLAGEPTPGQLRAARGPHQAERSEEELRPRSTWSPWQRSSRAGASPRTSTSPGWTR